MMALVMMKSAHQAAPRFVKTTFLIKRRGVIPCVKSYLLPQRLLLQPITSSSLYVIFNMCEQLFNNEPSIITLVYRSPSTPHPENISLIWTLETIISRCSDGLVLGDFNCPKVNQVSKASKPLTPTFPLYLTAFLTFHSKLPRSLKIGAAQQ